MNRTVLAALTRVSVVAILPLLPLGCNKDDDIPADAFKVTPASANLAKSGDSVVLQAVGGLEPMTWTLTATNGAMGMLSGSGRIMTFTRGAASGANTVQVMDDRTWTASAVIYLDTQTTTVSPDALAVSPTAITLSENRDTAVFIATKGTQPYRWALADTTNGRLDTDSGNQVIYTRDRPGNNTVILTDASNTVATATVNQPDGTTTLSISPASASLANNGETTVFLASGGTAPYTWYVADAARGHLSASSGDSVVYTRDGEGNNSVVLTDRYGNTVVAAVTQSITGSALSVTPPSGNIGTDGDIVVLVASGGTVPYHWSVVIPARGTLDSTHGISVIYTRTAIGNNTVQLTDADGTTIAIPITQSDSTLPLSVTPTSGDPTADGEVVVFVASGGTAPYNWTVAVPARGSLSAATGTSVTYTRTTAGNNTVQLTDANGLIKTVSVTQPDATAALAISPSPAPSLAANGDAVVFTASGGTPSYAWSLALPSRGSLSAASGNPVTYTRTTDGNNTVVLTDSLGRLATVGVTQSAPNELSARADPANLMTNGALSVITVSGGLPPYAWTLANGNGVILSTATQGVSGIYQRSSAGDNAIIIHDANSIQVSVVIAQP